ncbi:MAG: hypothetical protein H0V09_10560 [Gemmatimonadetes bacterium]|nr:hypothetical protein [Gemmatimonadota bacterium]
MRDLPSDVVVLAAFAGFVVEDGHTVLGFPVLSNASCEHHLVIYTAQIPDGRTRLVAFAKRDSRDPDVPAREWSIHCKAEMPASRLDQFVALLRDRLDGGTLEVREVRELSPTG